MARIVWAMMVSGETYPSRRRPEPAQPPKPGTSELARTATARWQSVDPRIGTPRGIQWCSDITFLFGTRSA
jgi:hypothetical protein